MFAKKIFRYWRADFVALTCSQRALSLLRIVSIFEVLVVKSLKLIHLPTWSCRWRRTSHSAFTTWIGTCLAATLKSRATSSPPSRRQGSDPLCADRVGLEWNLFHALLYAGFYIDPLRKFLTKSAWIGMPFQWRIQESNPSSSNRRNTRKIGTRKFTAITGARSISCPDLAKKYSVGWGDEHLQNYLFYSGQINEKLVIFYFMIYRLVKKGSNFTINHRPYSPFTQPV